MKDGPKYLYRGAFVAAILAATLPCLAKYSGGTGEPNDPYRIATPEDLNDIGNHFEDYNSHFVMVGDVNLAAYTGSQFNIIASSEERPFAGVFDGNDHVIRNFSYSGGDGPAALFGYVSGPNSVIKDLGIIDSYLDVQKGGTLAFRLEEGMVSNCFVENGVVKGYGVGGGLICENGGGIVENCSFSGRCTASGSGGIAASNGGTILRCSANVTILTKPSGGLVSDNHGTISECFSTGELSATWGRVGGLCYQNSGIVVNCWSAADCLRSSFTCNHTAGLVVENSGLVEDCYSVGKVEGSTYSGGLIGRDTGGTVVSSFWDVNTSEKPDSAGEPNAVGLPTDEMQMRSTFEGAGWDFNDVWDICEGTTYPQLKWSIPALDLPCFAKYSGGTGTPEDPYRIATPEDLNDIGNHFEDYNCHFVMVNDIDLSAYTGSQFNIIASSEGSPFTGVFDGNDHVIRNFTYSGGSCGLFGYVNGANALIKDLGMIDSHVVPSDFRPAGTLVVYLWGGTVSNCFVENGILRGRGSGGLVASNGGTIGRCSASVTGGGRYIGGLVGDNYGNVSECFSTGQLNAVYDLGGLCYWNDGTIRNCYSAVYCRGESFTPKRIAGLVTYNGGLVENCYSVGRVIGFGGESGGLIGSTKADWVVSSFWDIDTSGKTHSSGEPNAVGLPTSEMQKRSTFEAAGWDFNDVWDICDGTNYPRLKWAIPAVEFACPEGVDFFDYTYWADWWLAGCDEGNEHCGGADFDQSGTVDDEDLAILSRSWLEGIQN
ncbi:MAG: hypothetical protein ACYS8Z_07625 [Planctomycetota bacterium]|jgi:hypothetical protein